MNTGARLLILFLLSQLAVATAIAQSDEDGERRCLRLNVIDRTEIIDDQTIAFHMRNDDIYLNRLRRTCNGLDRNRPFSYSARTGQLCASDSINVLEYTAFGLQRGMSCSLGRFQPIDEDVLAVLKGEEQEAEVIVTTVEIEDEDVDESADDGEEADSSEP